ncbi:major facilitator superfamily protein [Actinidia rufa]|uniref:Major facilitator superfamily protein n=1 Tax=Actinidia rufa TaxID=165716 RepID=A0A7J0FAT6_9ERIC|nr:major facilitator superfamily protein [Actinidia rufa]
MEKLSGLSHLFMTVFLYNFSTFMVIPAITDVTMSALCPGEDECSLAIYLTGIQQAIIGLGTLVMMPLIGNLSDTYGRKAMLTVPMSLTIIPLVILAYSREKYYFYAYYALKTLTAMVCEGSVHCIALAYIADNISENRRASVFGILSGISSSAFVCGNLSTRFLSTPSTFQMLLMPMLAPVIGEEKLLSIGLFFSCAHGKAQGCISGLCSFGNVLSPLVFSPLTALFLSGNAPFHFPGFSIACAGFAVMVAFVQSIMIRAVHPNSSSKVSSYNCEEP